MELNEIFSLLSSLPRTRSSLPVVLFTLHSPLDENAAAFPPRQITISGGEGAKEQGPKCNENKRRSFVSFSISLSWFPFFASLHHFPGLYLSLLRTEGWVKSSGDSESGGALSICNLWLLIHAHNGAFSPHRSQLFSLRLFIYLPVDGERQSEHARERERERDHW